MLLLPYMCLYSHLILASVLVITKTPHQKSQVMQNSLQHDCSYNTHTVNVKTSATIQMYLQVNASDSLCYKDVVV